MASSIDLANIQGDILVGLPKKTQAFFFFQFQPSSIKLFQDRLEHLIPLITTSANSQDDRTKIVRVKRAEGVPSNSGDGTTKFPGLVKVAGVNLAFSSSGLKALGLNTNAEINDSLFSAGMTTDAGPLGDKGTTASDNTFTPDWDKAFLNNIHGVVLVTGESHRTINDKLAQVKHIFGHSVQEVATLVGDVRPGKEAGHEHFGFEDGVSQPAVDGVDTPLPGQTPVSPGTILLGREGDVDNTGKPIQRPSWALDGSFLAFRKLPQLVPEFNKFLQENALLTSDPTVTNGADLLGVRLIGRWKSGAPIAVTPLHDDPTLATDPKRNNNFQFTPRSQDACPFAAHVRKMNPRADRTPAQITPHLVLRRGIPFGPEVSGQEVHDHTTKHERGLYFVCYQSNLSNGFHFLQTTWANNQGFPINTDNTPEPQQPGFDPIIGQTNAAGVRAMSGATVGDPTKELSLTQEWVLSKGGEYFFSPSISALKEHFATQAAQTAQAEL